MQPTNQDYPGVHMNIDTTTYVKNDLGQVDVNYYVQKAHSLRAEALSSHSCSLCAVIKERLTAMMNSWML
ncbi:MAG: hypothetical protein ACI80S_001834 [Pseudohongiellaceae bacterium]|jgi:hypothetical protein